jgi:hypothetical protein
MLDELRSSTKHHLILHRKKDGAALGCPRNESPASLSQRGLNKLVRYRYTVLQWSERWPANLDRKVTFYFPDIGVCLPGEAECLCPALRQSPPRTSSLCSRPWREGLDPAM